MAWVQNKLLWIKRYDPYQNIIWEPVIGSFPSAEIEGAEERAWGYQHSGVCRERKEPAGTRDVEVVIDIAAMYMYPTTRSYNSR